MTAPAFIDLNGHRYDVVAARRAQLAVIRRTAQPVLFELRDDCRPPTGRTASGRYQEPSLFNLLD